MSVIPRPWELIGDRGGGLLAVEANIRSDDEVEKIFDLKKLFV